MKGRKLNFLDFYFFMKHIKHTLIIDWAHILNLDIILNMTNIFIIYASLSYHFSQQLTRMSWTCLIKGHILNSITLYRHYIYLHWTYTFNTWAHILNLKIPHFTTQFITNNRKNYQKCSIIKPSECFPNEKTTLSYPEKRLHQRTFTPKPPYSLSKLRTDELFSRKRIVATLFFSDKMRRSGKRENCQSSRARFYLCSLSSSYLLACLPL